MRFLQSRKFISLCFPVIFLFDAFISSYAYASSVNYPTHEWQVSAPEEQGMHSKTILEMMEFIKEKEYNIHSVTLVRNDSLVLDSYRYPFKNDKKHEMHSATKSVTSALIGIAIDKGYIKDVHQAITQLFPNKDISNLDELKRSLTLKDLLMMASGLDCHDGSANNWATTVEMRKSNDVYISVHQFKDLGIVESIIQSLKFE